MKKIEYLEKLNISEFFSYIKSLNENQKIELINNPYLKYLEEDKFRFLFFSLESEQAKILLSNKILYNKVLNLPRNYNNQTIFDILQKSKIDTLKLIIESDYITEYKDGISIDI